MERNFEKSLQKVLKHEGGWADHPNDPGGATMKGVTLATYRRYVNPKASKSDLREISDAEIATVYRRHYWDAVHANQLPSGLDYAMFDFGVNSGPSRAIKFLQKIVVVPQDGKMGPVTLSAVEEHNKANLILNLCVDRLAWLKRLNTWKTFGKGWARRVASVKSDALAMVVKGEDQAQPPQAVAVTNLTYTNQNAIRNLPIAANLEKNISQAIKSVFGEGYRGEIYSGGQPKKGSPGRRTGSIRHDDQGKGGRAADIRVYDPENVLVEGLKLARLGQYWLAKKLGSCGLQMRGGGIHLDEWITPPPGGSNYWTYKYSDEMPWGEDAYKMLKAGRNGVMPELAPVILPKFIPQKKSSNTLIAVIVGIIMAIAAAFGFEVAGGDISDYAKPSSEFPLSENEE